MKQLKNQRGLTLIELLAVIVILAIIAAIAAVAIGNVIQNSKDKAILSDAVAMLEGAKIAHMDGSCTEGTNDLVTCSGEQLKSFVEDVTMTGDDKVEISTAEKTGEKTYKVYYSEVDKIKNQNKYGVGKAQAGVDSKELLKVLNGNKDK
ncbi:MAG TPA: prepilin-type N-terminal cleavage/methylation domain-containing protein [Savagea sp.]